MDRGFPGVVVLAQFATRDHADDGLTQYSLMASDDGIGGRSSAVCGSQFELLGGQCIKRDPLHDFHYVRSSFMKPHRREFPARSVMACISDFDTWTIRRPNG